MTLETFVRQLYIWKTSNTDVPESTKFQDLVESLKLNKEVKGLANYVSKHILTTLNTLEKHKIKEVIECLETRYGRTRKENLEDLVVRLYKI